MGARFIDKYEIVSTLGRGSMGVVYKAKDPEIDRFVAIKTLKAVFMGDDPAGTEAMKRFRQESRSAGKLQHANIVTIFEAGRTSSGSPYIVMEFVEGRSFEKMIIDAGPLDIEPALHYLAQVASAIDYAHSRNVIHRDIKPSNVLVGTTHRPQLLDFGVAKLSDSSLTPAGSVVGTPSYMSPEQIRGTDLDGRTDIFSLAVVAYEIFAGVRPFPGTDFTTVVTSIIHKEPIAFSEHDIELPDGLEQVLAKGLSKDRDQRPESALQFVSEMADAVSLVIDGSGLVGGYAGPLPGSDEDPKKKAKDSMNSTKISPVVDPDSITDLGYRAVDDISSTVERTVDEVSSDLGPVQKDTEVEEDSDDGDTTVVAISPISEEMIKVSPGRGEEGKETSSFWAGGITLVAGTLLVLGVVGVYFSLSSTRFEAAEVESADVIAEIVRENASAVAENRNSESNEVLAPVSSSLKSSSSKPQASLPKKTQTVVESEAVLTKLAQLRDPSYEVKVAALKDLYKSELMTNIKVAKAVADCMQDDDELVRGFAAKITSATGSEESKALLRARLKVEKSEVVTKVIKKLLQEKK